MLVCTKDGIQLTCKKNGALLFNMDLTKYRRGDAYQCSQCGESIITGWGENYLETPDKRYIKDFKTPWDGILPHSEIIHGKEPFCLKCHRLMVDRGEGVLFLPDGHAYKKGKIWECGECGNKIIKVGWGGWPAPISEEEKQMVKYKYLDKVFYLKQ